MAEVLRSFEWLEAGTTAGMARMAGDTLRSGIAENFDWSFVILEVQLVPAKVASAGIGA